MSHLLRLQPVMTEKSLRLAEQGQFTFLIPAGFNKQSIASTVAATYSVHPLKVNIAKLPRKAKFRGRVPGYTSERIKAIVRLRVGERIPGFELPEPTKDDAKSTKSDHGHNHPPVKGKDK